MASGVIFFAQDGGMNFVGFDVRRHWMRQLMPMVCASAVSWEVFSPNSSRASRPTRYSAPVRGARMLSPEQSAKYLARTVWNRWVVVCQPVISVTIRSPFLSSVFASKQEQLRMGVTFSSSRILP